MIKNVAWDTKEKKISAVIFTIIFSSLLFFETMRASFNEITEILFIAVSGILFSLFFITSIEGKWNRIFSAQGIISVATVAVTLGLTESYQMGTTSEEGVYTLFAVSLMVLLARNLYLLPVAAVIGAVMSAMTTKPEFQSPAIGCIPAAVGIACIAFSKALNDSDKRKKIAFSVIFAISQLVMLASFGYVLYCRRYTITVHNLITEVWDSAASLIAVVILLALIIFMVPTIIKKLRSDKKKTVSEKTNVIIGAIIERFGYLAVALMGIVPMFMEMKIVFISAMGLYVVLLAASKEGSVADEVFNGILKALNPKNKNKSKAKSKKKKI